MIQILYGGSSFKDFTPDLEHGLHAANADHEARAKALASVSPGSQCGSVKISGIQKPGLDTLVYWGHGDATHFCGLTAEEFVADVSAWKKWNRGLKTVEILTCNARHSTTDLSFTSRVKPLLKKKYSDITFKAMPMGMGTYGAHTWSILTVHVPSKTWYYVTGGGAKDTDEMFPASVLVETEAKKHGNNFATAGAAVEVANPSRKFGLKYGTFANLRAALTPIA